MPPEGGLRKAAGRAVRLPPRNRYTNAAANLPVAVAREMAPARTTDYEDEVPEIGGASWARAGEARVLTLPEALRLAADRNRSVESAQELKHALQGRYVEERADDRAGPARSGPTPTP